ncbi:MAG: hypothetical protein PWP65_1655 [Clostridia bacterium]|nr:hypothetical protein [Clostridia bacterium]
MQINPDKCIGCENCLDYCPLGAIKMRGSVAWIDPDPCVECGTCYRSANCPAEAIERPELAWPRSIRQWFSDNSTRIPHLRSLGSGRGVDEVKNNDRTGYYKRGDVGFVVEVGRPGTSASFRDIEKLLRAMAAAGFMVTERSPLIPFLADRERGILKKEILGERVMTCSVEFKTKIEKIPEVIAVLRRLEPEVDTVFTVGVLSRVEPDGAIPTVPILKSLGIEPRPNAKINVGLGRPLVTD